VNKNMNIREQGEAENIRHAYRWLHEHCDLEVDADWLAWTVLRTALGAFELLIDEDRFGGQRTIEG
jgi:hypothetical protein